MNEVLFNQGLLVKYYYDKICSTAMSNSLGDIIDESIVSQKEVIIKFIQVTRYHLFIWDNQELENCP